MIEGYLQLHEVRVAMFKECIPRSPEQIRLTGTRVSKAYSDVLNFFAGWHNNCRRALSLR